MAEMCPSCKGTGKVITKAAATSEKPAKPKPKAVAKQTKPSRKA
jgi:hypothetical protein